jgi:superfamily II DNA helicase RecQ
MGSVREDFDGIFQHMQQYKIIVCKTCAFAVVPQQIDRHLREHHPQIDKQKRSGVTETGTALEAVAYSKEDVNYPQANEEPVEGLEVFKDGLQCMGQRDGKPCGYVCRTAFGIQKHCRLEHGWVNERGRGGNVRKKGKQALNRMWEDKRLCQRFFEYRQWQRYFVVSQGRLDQEDEGVEGEGEDEETIDADAGLREVLREGRAKVEEARQRQTVDGSFKRYVADPWLEYTGWHRHLQGFQWDDLLGFVERTARERAQEQSKGGRNVVRVREEDEGEEELTRACKGTRSVVRKAFEVCRPGTTGRAILEYVNRKEAAGDQSMKAFDGSRKPRSIKKYTEVWLKVLRYIWRTAAKENRPKYTLTDRQRGCLSELHAATREEIEAEEEWGSRQGNGGRKRREATERACLGFWLAMFDHELQDDEYESGIMSGLAVSGMSQNGGRKWRSALLYTPDLSGMVTVLRALVVYSARERRQDDIDEGMSQGLKREEAEKATSTVLQNVKASVHEFMTLTAYGGKATPLNHIMQQRTYGRRIRESTKASTRVAWAGETILIDKVAFSIEDIREVSFGLRETARKRLLADLMFVGEDGREGEGLPVLQLEQIVDDMGCNDEGWSFLTDGRNKFAVDGEEWLAGRVFRESRLREKFMRKSRAREEGRGKARWNERTVEGYFRQVRQFKEELFTLAHLSAGAPARGTELITVMHRSPQQGRGERGVFVDDGMVVFATSYHKNYQHSKTKKPIQRYLPEEVGELLVYYLWLVEPFVRILQTATRDRVEWSDYIWEPKNEEGWGEGGGSSEEEDSDEEEEEDGTQREEEGGGEGVGCASVASGKAKQTTIGGKGEAQASNVDGFWGTDRVRNTLKRETGKRIGASIGTSTWRQAYAALQRRYTRDIRVFKSVKRWYEEQERKQDKDMEEGSDPEEDIAARQACHTRRMEEMMYGLLHEEWRGTTTSEREGFRRVSRDWHRLIGWPSAKRGKEGDERVRQRVKLEEEQAAIKREEKMRGVDIEHQLRLMYGDGAEFRGLQEQALGSIVKAGRRRVLVVAGTGSGKSLLFMLPAAGSEDGLTIVVVPTLSLQEDVKRRCEAAGIRCAAWSEGGTGRYSCQIMVVIAEAAVTKAFARFIDVKRASRQLERIVIDECHTVLESTEEWRPEVRQLREMGGKGTQVVFLTATLPPADESRFFEVIGLEREATTVIRESTRRTNVAYRVLGYERGKLEEALQKLVEEKTGEEEEGKVVIYCKTIAETKRMAKVLGCEAYYREVGTEEEKRRIQAELVERGGARVFTATNALGLGVDAPSIRTVVHTGIPFDLRQYGQESGRAGRDGRRSEAIILQWTKKERSGRVSVEKNTRAGEEVRTFVRGERCRKVVLEEFMDGNARAAGCRAGEGEAVCDVCEESRVGADGEEGREREGEGQGKGSIGVVSREEEEEEAERLMLGAGRRKRNLSMMEADEERLGKRAREEVGDRWESTERLRKKLARYAEGCAMCVTKGEEGGREHEWWECGGVGEEEIRKMEAAWEELGSIEWESYSSCWGCKTPQAVCNGWEDVGNRRRGVYERRDGVACQFRGVLRAGLAAVLTVREEEAREWLEEVVVSKARGRDGEQGRFDWWEIVKKWLGRRVDMGGGWQGSGASLLFSKVACRE